MASRDIPRGFADGYLKEVQKSEDFPTGKCYVIQVFTDHTIYREGDERSKKCPGHGYPAYTEHVLAVRQFITQDGATWRAKLSQLYGVDKDRTDIAAFQMEKWAVQVRLEVEIG